MKFGIEQENFIFKNDIPPSNNELDTVLKNLEAFGYSASAYDAKGNIVCVEKLIAQGWLRIKSDYCTHIIEVAFPPFDVVVDFEEIYEEVYSTLVKVLHNEEIVLKYGGSLDILPKNRCLSLSNEYMGRIDNFLQRPVNNARMFHSDFLSGICATQVNLPSYSMGFDLLESVYCYEYLFTLGYSNSTVFNGNSSYCARLLAYRDGIGIGDGSELFPSSPPTSKTEYINYLKGISSGMRDYSLISWREDGRWEYRSTCSQNRHEQITEIVALRYAVIAAAKNNGTRNNEFINERIKSYFKLCENGYVCEEVMEFDLGMLQRSLDTLDAEYAFLAERAINHIKQRFRLTLT